MSTERTEVGGRPTQSLVEGCPCDGCEHYARCKSEEIACRFYYLWTRSLSKTTAQRQELEAARNDPRYPNKEDYLRMDS